MFTSDKPHYPYELPKGWVWCKLSDCCHIAGRIGFRGYTKDDLVEFQKGAITLSPSNIIDGEMDYNKCTYISWDKYEESPEIEVLEGDILLVKTGSSFGKCALVDKLPWKSTINPQFVILKYISINEQYLTWVLQSSYARNNYNDFVLGTAIPTFTQVVLGNMPIPLPPISEQLKIVNKLKHLFLSINSLENNKKSLCTLIKESKSKILDLAIHGKLVPQDPTDEPASKLLKRINPKAEIACDNGHYQKLPDGWCMTNIGSLFDAVSAKRVLKSEWKDKGVPFYRAREIVQLSKEGFADKDLFISENHYAEIKDKYGIPTYGDIMISAVGSIGYTYIVKEDDVFYYKDASVLCLKNTRHWNSKFFSIWLASPFLQEQMYKNSKGTTVDTITLEKIKEYAIPFPPLNEQHRIVAKIEEIFAQLDAIEASL